MKALGSSPEKTVYVGDALNDIIAGRAANVTTIGALYGVNAQYIRGKADYDIESIGEILKIIKVIKNSSSA